MSIRYMQKGDEDQCAALAPIKFEDDTAFWAGVQKCGAGIALAAVLAATALSTAQAAIVDSYHQDDPAGKLFGQDDEDFWQNPVAPVPAALGRLYLPDPEEIPATTLRGQPDEDFWTNPVAPVQPWTPFVFRDDDVAVQPVLGIDEDLWENPVPAVPASLGRIYIPDPEEIPAASLHGQPDEDYWQVLAPQAALQVSRVFSDDDVIATAAAPAFSPDEDYWPLPIVSAPASAVRAFSDDDVSFSSPAIMDEDLWTVPRMWSTSAPRLLIVDDNVAPQPLHTDEDFWVAPPARNWPPPPKLFAYDDVLFPAPLGPFVAVARGITITPTLSGSFAVRKGLSSSVTTNSSLVAKNFTIVAIL